MDAETDDIQIQLKAQVDTLTIDLDKANQAIKDKDAEISNLQGYIARYVCSDKKPEGKDPADVIPKTFSQKYAETISEMNKNSE